MFFALVTAASLAAIAMHDARGHICGRSPGGPPPMNPPPATATA